MTTTQKTFTEKEFKRSISGPKMAAYLRQIAAVLEESSNRFTAKFKITVFRAEPSPAGRERKGK